MGIYDAAITEAFAVDEGIRLAATLELQHIVVESDSAGVVEAIMKVTAMVSMGWSSKVLWSCFGPLGAGL